MLLRALGLWVSAVMGLMLRAFKSTTRGAWQLARWGRVLWALGSRVLVLAALGPSRRLGVLDVRLVRLVVG